MISISSAYQNPWAIVTFQESPDCKLMEASSRVKVYPTLDGGAYFVDHGFCIGDMQLIIRGDITEDQAQTLFNMLESENDIRVIHSTGEFVGVIQSLGADNGKLNMTVLVKTRTTW